MGEKIGIGAASAFDMISDVGRLVEKCQKIPFSENSSHSRTARPTITGFPFCPRSIQRVICFRKRTEVTPIFTSNSIEVASVAWRSAKDANALGGSVYDGLHVLYGDPYST